ncbi:putative TIM-barrel fold metal-dependent hydrolase [Hungatella effluvii]|uniref:6-methylsalicylate decarboxylase n=1 Tax=Hungatella effluvii TaxID=1096246 RepID=A0A2V3YBG9_9FIRM|nr:amidohydrolase family protein [Hungatella effluvii]PXX54270.1 putative TIM-barrel fold metal-dependent hydrolase [Hungatella effluvii]
MKKFDVHGHYFPPAYEELLKRHELSILDGAKRPAWSEEGQLSFMDELDIEKTALSISSPHLHMGDVAEAVETARACNEYGAGLLKKYPGRFEIMASLPVPEIGYAIGEIRYCREYLGIRNFALQTHSRGIYLGSEVLEPLMEELNRKQTVVAVHPTQPSAVCGGVNEKLPSALMEYFFETTRAVTNMLMNGTIRKYPNIRWIIPHAGAFLPVLSDRLATLAGALKLSDNLDIFGDLALLYYDLAGISMPKQYEVLQKIAPADHLMYGSDEPFTPPVLCRKLAEVMEQTIAGEWQEDIFSGNAERLYKEMAW